MSEPSYPPAARRAAGAPLPAVLLMLVLAFAAGLAVTALVGRRLGWFAARSAPVTTAAPRPAPSPAAPTLAADPATLATREQLLAGELAQLEGRAAAIAADTGAASGQATRAEAMLLALAARRAVDRGTPLGLLEAAVRERFGTGQPNATALILDASRQPLPSLEELRLQLDLLSGRLLGGGGWRSAVGRSFGALVAVHREGTPSPLPADRLAHARGLLAAGRADAAAAEVDRLPGAGAVAGGWLAAARRWALVHRGLDTIEVAALLGRTVPPPVGGAASPAMP